MNHRTPHPRTARPVRPATAPRLAAAVALALPGLAAPVSAATVGPEFFAAFAARIAEGVPAAEVPAAPTHTLLSRLAPPAYADGVGAPAGPDRPSPRVISNAISTPENRIVPEAPLSTLSVALLQLLTSHTHARTPTSTDPGEALHTPTLPHDPIATMVGAAAVMPMQRSLHEGGSGPGDPREQINVVTPRLDGSAVYGSDAGTLTALRTFEGGRLLSDAEGDLPRDAQGRSMAGDVRADENPVLLALHTLYHREHNRLAGEIGAACATAGLACSDEDIFQGARKLVVAGQQKILYEDLLPELLGRGVTRAEDLAALVPDPALIGGAPGAINAFTAAAGRIGHSQVPDTILLAEPGGPRREVPLARCFFDPGCLDGAAIEAILYGAALQPAEAVDPFVVDSLRNAQRPGFGATFVVDLGATNILRGREHGLPDYLAMRAALGFAELPLEALLPANVLAAYGDAEQVGIDLLVGLFSEFRAPEEHLGDTAAAIWALQFLELANDETFYTAPDQWPLVRDWAAESSILELIAANTRLGLDDFRTVTAEGGMAVVPLPPSLALLFGALGLLGGLARAKAHRAAAPGGR